MKKFLKLFVLLTLSFSLWAQENSENLADESLNVSTENLSPEEKTQELDGKLTLSKINFIGLKRTKDSHVQEKVKNYIGKSLSETDMHEFETDIQLIGLFDDIQISTEQISDSEAQINVSVKEKITFIPLPFVMFSSAGFSAGGIVLDSNCFGKQYMFMGGAFFSSLSKSGIVAFQKPSSGNGIPGISLFAQFASVTPKVLNMSNDTVYKYEALTFGCGVNLSEKITDEITFKNGYTYRHFSGEDYEGYIAPESINYGSLSLALEYSNPDWNGVFLSTNSVSLASYFGLTDSSDSDFRFPITLAFSIGEEHPIFTPKLRIYQKISGSFGFNNHILSYASQSEASVTIVPSNFLTEKIIGGNLGFEYALVSFSLGMISLYSDYQLVYAQDFNSLSEKGDFQFMHGPNGGFRIYFAKIAVPAVAVGFSYNVTKNYWQFAASVGMSF
ncbi:MAG: hypothetical protein K5873_03250 [Treponema sp.]|nr:hypothetical protein [Treponema sp.]